jgi:hypothetical protein
MRGLQARRSWRQALLYAGDGYLPGGVYEHDLSPAVRDSIKQDWLARWKERLGNPTTTPQQVMRTYVEELDITVAHLDNKMDWTVWDAGEDDFDSPPNDTSA